MEELLNENKGCSQNQVFYLIVSRLDRIEKKVDKNGDHIEALKEDKAMKKGAFYIFTSFIAVIASIITHIFTGFQK